MYSRTGFIAVIIIILISFHVENNVDYQGLWFSPELGFMKFEKRGDNYKCNE